jgi:hypothetical protein
MRRTLKMFQNRVLRRIFWPAEEEVTGRWLKLCNMELYNLYSFIISIMVIKVRIRWEGVMAYIGETLRYRKL